MLGIYCWLFAGGLFVDYLLRFVGLFWWLLVSWVCMFSFVFVNVWFVWVDCFVLVYWREFLCWLVTWFVLLSGFYWWFCCLGVLVYGFVWLFLGCLCLVVYVGWLVNIIWLKVELLLWVFGICVVWFVY